MKRKNKEVKEKVEKVKKEEIEETEEIEEKESSKVIKIIKELIPYIVILIVTHYIGRNKSYIDKNAKIEILIFFLCSFYFWYCEAEGLRV